MKAVSLKKFRIVTPESDQYSELAATFGATFQHLAQSLDNPAYLELLPVRYKVIDPDGRSSSIKHAEPK